MKKTLITLAALAMASVASAATTQINDTYTLADFEGNVLTLKHDLTNNIDWTLKVDVTVGTESFNDWGTTMLASGSNPTLDSYTNGFQLWQNKSHTDSQYKLHTSSGSSSTAWQAGETYTFTLNYDADAKTLTLDGSGYSATATLTAPVTFEQLSSGAVGKAGWELTITHTATIPEPATATLSLLALAGLAARRRRK